MCTPLSSHLPLHATSSPNHSYLTRETITKSVNIYNLPPTSAAQRQGPLLAGSVPRWALGSGRPKWWAWQREELRSNKWRTKIKQTRERLRRSRNEEWKDQEEKGREGLKGWVLGWDLGEQTWSVGERMLQSERQPGTDRLLRVVRR